MQKKIFISFGVIAFISIYGTVLFSDTTHIRIYEKSGSLKLTFIANEGVMVESPHKKVLIDALFDNPNPAYLAPPTDILEKMYAGQSPFDNIDLVLVTHNHPDHMSVISVMQFMKNNSKAKLILPKDAVIEMKTAGSHWEKIKDRVIAVETEVNTSLTMEESGISVKAFRTLHSGDRESPWNLMYFLNMEDWTVFHEGDFDGKQETFTQLGLENTEVDLALVHFWFPLHPVGSKLIQEVLKPKHIGLIHLPLRLYEDAPGKIDMVKQYYPDLFLLKESMEQKIFH